MLIRLRPGLLFVAIVLLGTAIKAPFAAARFRLYPDAIAYVNVARNLASGEGFVSTLKTSYFLDCGVRHSALPDWPPVYPLFAGAVMKAGLGETGLQVVNALLASLAAGLVFLIARLLFDTATAAAAGVMAAVSLSMFRAGLTALSDPLGVVLALGCVAAAILAQDRPRWWFAAGSLAGAAFLTRYPNGVLLPALVWLARAQNKRWRNAGLTAAGFLIFVAPFVLWKWALLGSPLCSVQVFHYLTDSFQRDAWLWRADGPVSGSAPVFSLEQLLRNVCYLTAVLLRRSAGLQFLSAGLVYLLYLLAAGRAGKPAAEHRFVIAAAALSFIVYALTPSLPTAQGNRFMLPTFSLLLPFCAAGLVRMLRSGRAVLKIAAVAACIAAVFFWVKGYFSPEADALEFAPLDSRIVRWAQRSLEPGTIVASNNPWLIAHFTRLPACALPHNLDPESLRAFIVRMQVGALVILSSRRQSITIGSVQASRRYFRFVDLGCGWAAIPGASIEASQACSGNDMLLGRQQGRQQSEPLRQATDRQGLQSADQQASGLSCRLLQ